MNTYNDNLHSGVVTTLLNQQTELKNTQATLTASTYTLFYAEGGKITAQEKLDDDTIVYDFKQQVKDAAVLNNNIAVNVNGTAQDQKSHTALSVTNTAVGAANVQIAANAILKLASNVGSIYSIVSAANYDTEIYLQSEEANRLMGFTAYEAERTSQLAMEASALTAKVSSSTVADMATSTQKSVNDMLNVTLTDFNTISATIATDNANLATANNVEKKAEGVVKFNNADYYAAQSAYVINNRELNLNLRVMTNAMSDTFFDVAFNFYKSPFILGKHESQSEVNPNEESDIIAKSYPVKSYYIMVVKDSNKSIFSISNAEAMLLNPSQFVQVDGAPSRFDQKFIKETIAVADLDDSDGDSIQFGTKYVVFVLAVFVEEYKKIIGVFDDYITAPSNTFVLTNTLASPEPGDIKISKEQNNVLEFEVYENKDFEVEYRCMLLPDKTDLIEGLLTETGLRNFEKEIQGRERIADKFVPPITKLNADILSYKSQLEALKEEQQSIRKAEQINKDKPEVLKKLKKEYEANQVKREDINAKLKVAEKKLKTLEAEQKAAVKKLMYQAITAPGFFFNLDIAQTISIANYTVAVNLPTKSKENQKEKNIASAAVKNGTTRYLQVTFELDTNDVFGNRIEDDVKYIPAILSVSKALVENQVQFMNSLSDFEKTKPVSNVIPSVKL